MSRIKPQGCLCWYCGEKAATTSDHVVPKSKRKGLLNNRVPACRDCNQAKGARTPEEFREWMKEYARLKPNTTKHSIVAIKARDWVFYGEAEKES